MQIRKLIVVAAGVAVMSSSAFATDYYSGVGVGASTLGYGLSYKYGVNDNFGLHVGYNGLNYSRTQNEDGTDYTGKLKLSNFDLRGEYRPFGGVFAIAAGLVYNDNKVDLEGVKSGSATVTLDGKTYNVTNGSARYKAKLDSNKLSPYVGLAWQTNPRTARGLSFNARLGVMYQTPTGSLTVSGIDDPTGTLEADRAAEEARLNESLEKLKWYPVVGFGVNYNF
ncbi:MAG TPA: hypothetical protein VLC92_07775 [Rhodocyclaceae bacterium]|nr:hypothetical protein [Rhodocyclaceae bacterium]